ncbi:hypothetical protein CTheo_8332 [Ceratobasidium theobromae]|uniref:Uncharacterized protein n=1 Tax=Ceratobasidium theobromae TaxID=1582974 RepID=A0A5N5Q975_9AGAM|nr:hypothetical protein CTheo_8332 [Ceratobasidium theobromae]
MYYELQVNNERDNLTDQELQKLIWSSISSPPPKPTSPGNWVLLRDEHWMDYDAERGINVYWATLSDDAIYSVTSHEHMFRVGLVNTQQKGLFEGIMNLPIQNHSRLQRHVYEFVNGVLQNSNHPLAFWHQVTHGIRRDANRVWSPYDLIGYRFMRQLSAIHGSIPHNYGHDYMLRVMHAILREPGRYAKLVRQFYPVSSALPVDDDPLGVTFLDHPRQFNPSQYDRLNIKAVIHYMWEVLKIPRRAAQFNLEPFVQLSSKIQSAVATWLELTNPDAGDEPQLTFRSSMTKSQSEIGPLFLEPEQVSFECGVFLLEDDVTGAIVWEIPPPERQDAVTRVQLCNTWMLGHGRIEFEAKWKEKQDNLGMFEFM